MIYPDHASCTNKEILARILDPDIPKTVAQQVAHDEIVRLRAANEILSAKVDKYLRVIKELEENGT